MPTVPYTLADVLRGPLMKVGTPGAHPESLLVPVEATEDERALARLCSWGDDPLAEIVGWPPSAIKARCAYLIRAVTHRPELKEASDEAVLFELDLHRIGAPEGVRPGRVADGLGPGRAAAAPARAW